MVEIFCNIPLKNVLQIKAIDINKICEQLSKLFTKKITEKYLNGYTYINI